MDIPVVLKESTYENIIHRLISFIKLLFIWIVEDRTLNFQGLYFTIGCNFPRFMINPTEADLKIESFFETEMERKFQIISYGFNSAAFETEHFIRNLLKLFKEKKGDEEVKAIFDILLKDMYFMKRDSVHMSQ